MKANPPETPTKPHRERRNMRLTTLNLDEETDAILDFLKRRNAQPKSVIIRQAVREYYAAEMRKAYSPIQEP